MSSDLERKVQALTDRQEIWDVMVRYSRGVDRLDRELVRSCYHDDAIDDHGMVIGTPDEFIDVAFALHTDMQFITHHVLANHTCELAGDDAYAETYYLFVGLNKEAPHLFSAGRYVDHLQRRDGEWRILNRRCVLESVFDVTENQVIKAMKFTRDEPLPDVARDRTDFSYDLLNRS